MTPLTAMREWNAETYHRVSNPQAGWGVAVLDRLTLRGDELVLDVGCGTGRLTGMLLERLPGGRVIATDLSSNMLAVAKSYLEPRFATRVRFARADAAALPLRSSADAVFSTATFHWILDHPSLFTSLFSALKPGGRLVAQCGGGPNIKRVRDRCEIAMRDAAFAPFYAGWRNPWEFADAETTAARLREAGFIDIHTSLEPAPVLQPDADAYREFVTHVICRHHLACLPDDVLRDRFMDEITVQAGDDRPPFELDYWRLNIDAVKPATASA
jgi:trans-aconitate 2-methyltransferase